MRLSFLLTFFLSSCCSLVADRGFIFLGDDFSDAGNMVGAPYSDGPPWPVELGNNFNIVITPSKKGGTDFAEASAFTQSTVSSIPVTEQLTQIPSGLSRKFPVFVFAGVNDIDNASSLPPTNNAPQNIVNILKSLRTNGFTKLIVLNIPNTGSFPAAGNSIPPASQLTPASANFNAQLKTLLGQQDFPVLQIDIANLYVDMIANPQKYGFTNVTSASPGPSMTEGYLFWSNGIDPTLATHEIIADYVTSILSAPCCFAHLGEEPFGLYAEQKSVLHQQLFPVQFNREIGAIYPFIGGNYSPNLRSYGIDRCGHHFRGNGGNVTVGLTSRFVKHWSAAIAGGFTINHFRNKNNNNSCRFDLRGTTLALILGMEYPRLYINAIGTGTYLAFHDIHRKFFTGPAEHKAEGHTRGNTYAIDVYSGLYLLNNHEGFHSGPIIDIDYQTVRVHGYKEHGASVGNLHYKEQKNHAFVTGIGWEATSYRRFKPLDLTIDTYLLFNRQWHQGHRRIRYAEVGLDSNFYSTSVYVTGANFGTFNLNLSTSFKKGQTITVGYMIDFGEDHIRESFINVSLNLPLGKKIKD